MGVYMHILLSFIVLINTSYLHLALGGHDGRNYMVNVDDFGAKADGTDDSKAFLRAWDEACHFRGSIFVVPRNKVYHLKPTNFSGPCHSATLKIYGTIKATVNQSDYDFDGDRYFRHWLVFQNLQNFTVTGDGTVDGNGRGWWDNSCKVNKNQNSCNQHAPKALTFLYCNNLVVKNIRMRNAPQMHISIEKSENVKASKLLIVAPEKSIDTDGIHISGTQNIHISKCVIMTGVDCVAIVNGSRNVLVTDLKCGAGHGISIGSLGKNNVTDHVSDITVNRATLSNTTNGVRIKSWQGGSGSATNIKFLNIKMHNVSNPIIIDQNYCDREQPCPEQFKAVQVTDVLYHNISGTTESEIAIIMDCSKTFPCQGIQLQNVVIRREDGVVKASFKNVKLETVRAFY